MGTILGTGQISEVSKASTVPVLREHSTLDLSPECVVGTSGRRQNDGYRSPTRFPELSWLSERRQVGSLIVTLGH
jgi:hypothetical protein